MPEGRVWTSKEDSATLPTWLGIPGLRHTLGLSRWWHFSVNLLWVINGVVFYTLLFSTDQRRRLVPLTWEVFPAALSTAIQYASLSFRSITAGPAHLRAVFAARPDDFADNMAGAINQIGDRD
ncbi:hypothetical protein [Bradyrhizobium brasilense]|uniref:hypothetical protein n=1 Tax=Bradyrhizobium brasilense TaxID=1419277 RepID=UPI001E4EC248|nr:hypothetical protein [Bradyrhizobium brasilense]